MDGGALTHLDEHGRARMVDVSGKDVTHRTARARGFIRMEPATLAAIVEGRVPKGDVLAAARIAGIMAAKRTPELVPLCHSVPLDSVDVAVRALPETGALEVEASASARWVTGVEMEALTAVCVALLTVYDMAKALDRGMRIEGIELLQKTGGRSGTWTAPGGDGPAGAP